MARRDPGTGRRRRADRPTRRRRIGVAIVVVLVWCLLVAVPSPERFQPPAHAPDQGEWLLGTGSRLRYAKITGEGAGTPVVVLHGGPGTPDLVGDAAYFGRLAADGHDVYVYDQLGSGGSARRSDPREYTLDADVADLEAIRDRIGADRVILIGHSYGASVLAGYLAAHPDHVDRAVVLSPAPLDPRDRSPGELASRLGRGRQLRLYARLLRPRNLLVYALLQVDPRAAHAVAGDREMDAQNDRVYATSEPALHCAGRARPDPPTGTGFYRLQYPQSATAPARADLRDRLRGDPTRLLIVKGSCDYLSWTSAMTWRATFPNAVLVYRPGGHNVYQDDPEVVLTAISAFLADRPLPVPPYRGPAAPADYEGPP